MALSLTALAGIADEATGLVETLRRSVVLVRGRVVGIASMVLSPGVALAVPAHVAGRFVRSASARACRRAA